MGLSSLGFVLGWQLGFAAIELAARYHAFPEPRIPQSDSEAVAALDCSFPRHFSTAQRLPFRGWPRI
jgi:hypothetical protein